VSLHQRRNPRKQATGLAPEHRREHLDDGLATPGKRAKAISEASPAQRSKVRGRPCLECGRGPCHPAHLIDRGRGLGGGCDEPACVVPLCAACHRAYDTGQLDLLPALVANGRVDELAHAIERGHADPVSLVERTTNTKWEAAT
jgi:hypothetical protein